MPVPFDHSILNRKTVFWAALLLTMLCSTTSHAITYTWTGATNNNWSDSSNWNINGVPGFADDVIFNASAGTNYTVFIDKNAACHSIQTSGACTVTVDGLVNRTLYIHGEMRLQATATSWTFSGTTRFESQAGVPEIIETQNTVLAGSIYFGSPSPLGRWYFFDDFSTSGTVTLIRGELDFNGRNVSMHRFASDNGNARTLNISGADITITGSYNHNNLYSWDIENSTNLTLTASSLSHFHFTGGQVTTMATNNLSYNAVVNAIGLGTWRLFGDGNSFVHLNMMSHSQFDGASNVTDILDLAPGMHTFGSAADLEVTASFNANGNCADFVTIKSIYQPSALAVIDFTFGSPAASSVIGLIIEGVHSTYDWNLAPPANYNQATCFNMQPAVTTNWPITTATPNTYTWIGGTGNWSNPANWLPFTGCIPSPIDHVVFNSSFGAPSDACTVDLKNATCEDMTWDPTIPLGVSLITTSPYNHLSIYGSLLTQPSGPMYWDFEGITHFTSHAASTKLVDVSTHSVGLFYFDGAYGNWDLDGSFQSHTTTYVYAGNFNTQGFPMDVNAFNASIYNTRQIDLQSSTINCTAAWDIHDHHATGGAPDPTITFNAGTSHIIMITGDFQSSNDYGNTYHQLTMANVHGRQRLFATDNTFQGDVLFMGNGHIPSNNFYETNLIFSEGKMYDIGSVQTLNTTAAQLVANGSCNGYIFIKGGQFDKPNTGTLPTVDYCVIKNNTASSLSLGSYTANNSVDAGGNAGWNILPPPYTGPLYFKSTVSNDWNDGDNWYNDPGFTTQNSPACPPNALNDVYFINGSFPGAYPNGVDINITNAFCKSMYWGDPSGTPGPPPATPYSNEANTGQALHIFGNLLLAPVMSWGFDGDVWFEGNTGSTTYTITSNGNALLQDVFIDGDASSTWELQDDFETGDGLWGIGLITGTLDAAGNDITSGHIHSSGNNIRALDITNSTVNLMVQTYGGQSYAWSTSAPSSGFSLSASPSTVNLENIYAGGEAWLSANDVTFGDVVFKADAVGYIRGDNNKKFENVTFLDNGFIQCDNEIRGTLTFSPASIYNLTSGTRQSITNTGDINASGTVGNIVYIRSSVPGAGNEAEISKDGGVVCLNYASIRDNDAILLNGAQLYDGPNGFNVSNNTGWSFTACSPDTVDGCVGDSIQFTSLFNGTSFNWDFGDGSGTSTQAQPWYAYATAGTYTVSVTVVSNTTTDVQYFVANISASCCLASDDSTYTDINGILGSSAIWPDKVFVSADVFVPNNVHLEIANSDVVFEPNTGIYMQDDAHLEAINSTFRPCSETQPWTGIDFDNNATARMNENAIVGAESGLSIVSDGKVSASNNQFINCEEGIYLDIKTNTSMGHLITGNTFVINADNAFTNGTTAVDFFGIQLTGLQLEGVVSQNDFAYTSSISNVDRCYGIHNNGGSLSASENNFTNITYPYVQVGGLATNAFENNEIDFNKAATGLYSSASQLVGVTVDGTSSLTLIGNNRMTLSYASGQTSTGVYGEGSDGLVVHGNTITGFEYGVQLHNGFAQEVSTNEVVDSDFGIYAFNMSDLDVEDNAMKHSRITGIALEECFSNTNLRRNTIKMDPDQGGTAGISYIAGADASNVYISDNCVFDAEDAMYLEGLGACRIIPQINDNYLFNYSNTGMLITELTGNVGTAVAPGQNSFVSNSMVATDVHANGGSCASPAISIANNWPSGLVISGSVTDLGGSNNSYATCGNQTLKEGDDLPALQRFALAHFPLDFKDDQYVLEPTYLSRFEGLETDALNAQLLGTHAALCSNPDASEAEAFVQGVSVAYPNNVPVQWLQYNHQRVTGDWDAALAKLEQLTPTSGEMTDLKKMESIRAFQYANHGDLRKFGTADSNALNSIQNLDGRYAAQARDLLHIAYSAHPYRYAKVVPFARHSHQAEARTQGSGMTIYPNPTAEKVHLLFPEAVSGNITLLDLYGKILFKQEVNEVLTSELDLERYADGIYMIHFDFNGQLETQRIVKSK